MNRHEFIQWFDFHRVNSEKFRQWFKSLKAGEKNDLRDAWFKLLGPLSLTQARAATNRMIATLEMADVPPEEQGGRVYELGLRMNDPAQQRAKEAQEAAKRERDREERARLEEEFGGELDRISVEDLEELIETMPPATRCNIRKAMGLTRAPLRHGLIRPSLLKALRQRARPAEVAAGEKTSEERFDEFRKDIFAGLGEAPRFDAKTNDQWEQE